MNPARRARRQWFRTRTVAGRELTEKLGLAAFLLLLVVFAGLLSPRFLAPDNLRDILVQAAPLGFVVIGQTFVIITRGLDLSVASLMATTAVLATAFNTLSDAMIPAIFVCGIGLGAFVGFVNGVLVTKRRISPFLATLAVMIVLQGLRFAYTKGAPQGTLPEGFRFLATGSVMGVPVVVCVLALTAVALAVLLNRTVFGRRLLLLGTNPAAARLSGIAVDRLTIWAYVISGVLAALGGLFLVGFVGIVDNWTGRGYELDSIAAAIVGGASLAGGKGSVAGSLLGAMILVSLFNIVLMLGLSVEFQLIVKGLIIVAAAAFYLSRR